MAVLLGFVFGDGARLHDATGGLPDDRVENG